MRLFLDAFPLTFSHKGSSAGSAGRTPEGSPTGAALDLPEDAEPDGADGLSNEGVAVERPSGLVDLAFLKRVGAAVVGNWDGSEASESGESDEAAAPSKRQVPRSQSASPASEHGPSKRDSAAAAAGRRAGVPPLVPPQLNVQSAASPPPSGGRATGAAPPSHWFGAALGNSEQAARGTSVAHSNANNRSRTWSFISTLSRASSASALQDEEPDEPVTAGTSPLAPSERDALEMAVLDDLVLELLGALPLPIRQYLEADASLEPPTPSCEAPQFSQGAADACTSFLAAWVRASDFDSSRALRRILRALTPQRVALGQPLPLQARDVTDALLTGAYKLLPGRDSRGRRALLVHMRRIDHERCPPLQYARCLTYLLQVVAQDKENRDGGKRGGVIVIVDAKKETSAAKVRAFVDVLAEDGSDMPSATPTPITPVTMAPLTAPLPNASPAALAASAVAAGGAAYVDPQVCHLPLVVHKIIVVNAGPMVRAALIARRAVGSVDAASSSSTASANGGMASNSVSINSGGSASNLLKARASGGGGGGGGGGSGGSNGGSSGGANGVRRPPPAPAPPLVVLGSPAKSDWVREVGEAGLALIPDAFGGRLISFSWEAWIGYRIQREDVLREVRATRSRFTADILAFLDAAQSLGLAATPEQYRGAMREALACGLGSVGLSLPVAWVKRVLGDVVEARSAHEALPWEGGSVKMEVQQLWKDMRRDTIEVDGKVLGADVREPGAVIAVLAARISQVAEQRGTCGPRLSEVECMLAARDVLVATKRTTSGGDVWLCVDRLCRSDAQVVVVCPLSNEADALHISVRLVLEGSDVAAIAAAMAAPARESVRRGLGLPLASSPSAGAGASRSDLFMRAFSRLDSPQGGNSPASMQRRRWTLNARQALRSSKAGLSQEAAPSCGGNNAAMAAHVAPVDVSSPLATGAGAHQNGSPRFDADGGWLGKAVAKARRSYKGARKLAAAAAGATKLSGHAGGNGGGSSSHHATHARHTNFLSHGVSPARRGLSRRALWPRGAGDLAFPGGAAPQQPPPVQMVVAISCVTRMSYKICEADPSSEAESVLALVDGVYQRSFVVTGGGAPTSGLHPTDDNPVVRVTARVSEAAVVASHVVAESPKPMLARWRTS